MPRLLLLFVGGFVAACSIGCESKKPFADRNVIMIVLDTTRFDHLGMYGYAKNTTPFLDSLAEDVVIFDWAYSASSWTEPAVASMFTSLYPEQHGVLSGYFFSKRASREDPELSLNRIPDGVETLPEMMCQAGYRTFAAADNPNICERGGFSRGFDRFAAASYLGGKRLNEAVLGWKDELALGGSPYFLYLHYMDPHRPYNVREPYFELEGTVAKDFVESAARYDSEIRYTDELIRTLFDELEIGPNTLVVVTADHGEEFGDHGRKGHDRGLYEELVHVPLFVVGRNRGGGLDFEPGRVPQRVSTLDLLPTLRELVGEPAAGHVEGVSIRALLDGAREEPDGNLDEERLIFAHRVLELTGARREVYSVWQGPWQLIYDLNTRQIELFNREKDRFSLNNRVKARPRIKKRLLGELRRFQKRPIMYERQFAAPLILDQDAQDELGRLGYSE